MADMGHNGGPPLIDRSFKKRWVNALFAVPKKPYGSIAMAFKIYMEMDGQGRGAVISDDEFRASCGVSDGSCRLFKKWLVDKEFIRIIVRGQRGRKSEFQAILPSHIAAYAAAISDEMAAPIAVNSEEYRQPLPVIGTEIPATVAAICEPAAHSAGILPAPRARIESSLREDISKHKQQDNLLPLEQEAAREGGRSSPEVAADPAFPHLNGTGLELVRFIRAHGLNLRSDEEARAMLRTNLQAFGTEAMLEAWSATQGEMATRVVAQPYKYLMGCARNAKERIMRNGGSGAGRETDTERLRRQVREANARTGGRLTR